MIEIRSHDHMLHEACYAHDRCQVPTLSFNDRSVHEGAALGVDASVAPTLTCVTKQICSYTLPHQANTSTGANYNAKGQRHASRMHNTAYVEWLW